MQQSNVQAHADRTRLGNATRIVDFQFRFKISFHWRFCLLLKTKKNRVALCNRVRSGSPYNPGRGIKEVFVLALAIGLNYMRKSGLLLRAGSFLIIQKRVGCHKPSTLLYPLLYPLLITHHSLRWDSDNVHLTFAP